MASLHEQVPTMRAISECSATIGVLPIPQRCEIDGVSTIEITSTEWVIASDLSDGNASFAATFLQSELKEWVQLDLALVDMARWGPAHVCLNVAVNN
jgi:hypothetical protein